MRVTFVGLSCIFLLCFCSMRDSRLLAQDGLLDPGIHFLGNEAGGLPFIKKIF